MTPMGRNILRFLNENSLKNKLCVFIYSQARSWKIYEVVFSLTCFSDSSAPKLFIDGFQLNEFCSVEWKVNKTLKTDYIKIWLVAGD